MSTEFKIAVLPGDGVGTEIMEQTKKVLKVIEPRFNIKFNLQEHLIGQAAYRKYGKYLTAEAVEQFKKTDAILLGATGISEVAGRELILNIRQAFKFFANIRPMKGHSNFNNKEFDFIIVRELSSGMYFGKRKEAEYTGLNNNVRASDNCTYSVKEIEQIARIGFKYASKRKKQLISIDKANVMATSRLWRQVVEDVAKDYSNVEFSHMLVDNAAMQIVRDPSQFDIMLTSNLIGDILSDEAAAVVGSLGLIPSASIGEGNLALYEPVHGSAPDIAGQDIANPTAMILSSAMMLRYSLNLSKAAEAVEQAVKQVFKEGYGTADMRLKNVVGTEEFGDMVVDKMR